MFILETLHWRVIGSILLRFWTNFEPMSQRKHQFTAVYSYLSAWNLLTYWKLVRNYRKLLVSTRRGSKWSRFVSICLNLSLQYCSFSWIVLTIPWFSGFQSQKRTKSFRQVKIRNVARHSRKLHKKFEHLHRSTVREILTFFYLPYKEIRQKRSYCVAFCPIFR